MREVSARRGVNCLLVHPERACPGLARRVRLVDKANTLEEALLVERELDTVDALQDTIRVQEANEEEAGKRYGAWGAVTAADVGAVREE